jgi:hypothetical protein
MGKQFKSIADKFQKINSILSEREEKRKEKKRKEDLKAKEAKAAIQNFDSNIVLPTLEKIKQEVTAAGFKAVIEEEENTIGHDLTVFFQNPDIKLMVGVFYNYQTERVELWGNLEDSNDLYELDFKNVSLKITSEEMLVKVKGAIDELLLQVERQGSSN